MIAVTLLLGRLRRRGQSRRAWLVPVVAAVATVALFVAGVVAWRMTSGPVPPGRFYFPASHPPHRLHPLRAELLWAASVLFALVAISVSQRRRSDTAPTVTA
jgi:hypothetical protein